MEVAEQIVDDLQKEYPGFKVVFAGDMGKMPPEVEAAMKQLNARMDESVLFGRCFDCGAQMPNYIEPGKPVPDDWQPARGWSHYSQGDEILHWVCPQCEAEEEEE